MRAKAFVRATIVVGLTVGSALDFGSSMVPFSGASPAEAKGFYTRKRVNGEWITGEFAKRGRSVATYRNRTRRVATNARVITAAAAWTAADLATAMPVPRPADPSSPATREAMLSPPADQRLLKLQHALQARAREFVTAPSLNLPHRDTQADPTSVSFDFQSGLKTTTYGSTIVMEGFDVAAAKALVSPRPSDGAAVQVPVPSSTAR